MAKVNPKTDPTIKPADLANVTVNLELVTPEMAGLWLKNSPAFNRGIGKRVVLRYSNAMIENRWWFTGESIVFDSGEPGVERLLDGWHRCTAIVDSGVAGWFVVVRGVPARAFHYMDHGRGRVFRDTLAVLQNPNSTIVAAATSYLTGFKKFGRFTVNGMEDHDKWAIYEVYKDRLNEVQDRYNRRLPLKGVPGGLLTAAHIVLGEKDADAADEFMELVLSGDGLEPDHPIAQFRHYCKKQSELDIKPSNLPTKLGAALVKAWNLVRQGEKVAKFVAPSTTPEPV